MSQVALGVRERCEGRDESLVEADSGLISGLRLIVLALFLACATEVILKLRIAWELEDDGGHSRLPFFEIGIRTHERLARFEERAVACDEHRAMLERALIRLLRGDGIVRRRLD